MKKIILATALAACTSTYSSAKNMSIDTSPFLLAIGAINGVFLYDVNENLSVGPELLYWGFDLSGDELKLFSGGVRAEYMPSGNKNSGLYLSGSAEYTSASVATSDNLITCEADVSAIGATGLGGYKYVSNGGFIAKIGAGFSVSNTGNFEGSCSDNSTYNESLDLPVGGLALELALGYKF